MEPAGEDLDLLRDAAARGVHEVQQRHLEALSPLLDADDLGHRLLPPGAGLDRVVIGHDADGAPPDTTHAGHHTVGGGVGFLIAREEEVFLELGPGIEEELEPVAYEELALLGQLGAVLGVALLDAGALSEVALVTHRPGPRRLTSPRAEQERDQPRG